MIQRFISSRKRAHSVHVVSSATRIMKSVCVFLIEQHQAIFMGRIRWLSGILFSISEPQTVRHSFSIDRPQVGSIWHLIGCPHPHVFSQKDSENLLLSYIWFKFFKLLPNVCEMKIISEHARSWHHKVISLSYICINLNWRVNHSILDSAVKDPVSGVRVAGMDRISAEAIVFLTSKSLMRRASNCPEQRTL